MKYIKELPKVENIRREFPISEKQRMLRKEMLKEIQSVLEGKSSKKIICIGPCSADREDAVLDYMVKLAELQEKLKERFVFIPRIYTSKPRTNGLGYKGILHRPDAMSGEDDIFAGVIAMRKMHLHVIQETGMFGADELLYTEANAYISDLLSYVAVGARSVENQEHRLIASGLKIPVGMKNPTSGDLTILLNSIVSAQSGQLTMYRNWEVATEGNDYAHAILRGYVDRQGISHPNYHYEDLCDFYDLYQKKNLKNMGVIIDCNHANSRKHYDEQIRIAKEIFGICNKSKSLSRFVKGVMIESYLEDGNQIVGQGVYGKSVTDACLGWKKTEQLLYDLAEM